MTFLPQKGLFRIDDYFADVHVGRTRQETSTKDDLLATGQLAEMGKRRRHTIGTRVIEQRVDGADERVIAIV